MIANETADKIYDLLNSTDTPFRLLEHEPEGRTDLASIIRGNRLEEAAKAMVLAAVNGKDRRYILAVVGGNRRIDFNAIKKLTNSSYVGLAPKEKAEALTGCVMGSVPPFSFHPNLTLMVDRELLRNEQIVFNAGRLDRSIFLSSEAYVALARPQIHSISTDVSS